MATVDIIRFYAVASRKSATATLRWPPITNATKTPQACLLSDDESTWLQNGRTQQPIGLIFNVSGFLGCLSFAFALGCVGRSLKPAHRFRADKGSTGCFGLEARLNPIQEPTPPNSLPPKEDTSSPPSGCTSGCTGNAETGPTVTVEALAAALLGLSLADRARLVAMLLGHQTDQPKGEQ